MKNLLTEWREFLKEQEDAPGLGQKQRYSSLESGADPIADDEVEKMTYDVVFPDGSSLPTGLSGTTYSTHWDQLDRLADVLGLGPGNRISRLAKTALERYKAWESRPKIRERIKQQVQWYRNATPEEKEIFNTWAKHRSRRESTRK